MQKHKFENDHFDILSFENVEKVPVIEIVI